MFEKITNQWVEHPKFQVQFVDHLHLEYREGNHTVKIFSEGISNPYRKLISISLVKHWGDPFENEIIDDKKREEIRMNIEASLKFLELNCQFE